MLALGTSSPPFPKTISLLLGPIYRKDMGTATRHTATSTKVIMLHLTSIKLLHTDMGTHSHIRATVTRIIMLITLTHHGSRRNLMVGGLRISNTRPPRSHTSLPSSSNQLTLFASSQAQLVLQQIIELRLARCQVIQQASGALTTQTSLKA